MGYHTINLSELSKEQEEYYDNLVYEYIVLRNYFENFISLNNLDCEEVLEALEEAWKEDLSYGDAE